MFHASQYSIVKEMWGGGGVRRLSGNVLSQSSGQFTTNKHVTTTVQQHLTMLHMVDYSAATTDYAMRMLENQPTSYQLAKRNTKLTTACKACRCFYHTPATKHCQQQRPGGWRRFMNGLSAQALILSRIEVDSFTSYERFFPLPSE